MDKYVSDLVEGMIAEKIVEDIVGLGVADLTSALINSEIQGIVVDDLYDSLKNKYER
jgi:hypothetical protein